MNLTLIAIAIGGAGFAGMVIGAVVHFLPARYRQVTLMGSGLTLIAIGAALAFFAPPLKESCISQTKDGAYEMWEKGKRVACDYLPWCEPAPRR